VPNPAPGPAANAADPGPHAGGPIPGHDLLGRIGHELRSPLTGILGMTRIMLLALAGGQPDTERQTRQLELIRAGTGAALRTIDRVVEVAQLDGPGPPAQRFDCRPAVAGAADAVHRSAPASPVRLLLDLPDEPVVVTGVPDRLSRLLHELIDNAVTHAEATTVRVAVRPVAGGVVIEVADDGTGIRADEQARLFTPFERGESTTGRASGGTGLGLYLAQRLAGQCGGRIGLRGTPGGGSTFSVRLGDPAASPGRLG
jgi:signal transduction histidine kinase